jgi:hypothetical protein
MVTASIEVMTVFWGSYKLIGISILVFLPALCIGVIIGFTLVAIFSIRRDFYTLIGKPMLMIACYIAILLSVLSCISFWGLPMNRNNFPHISGLPLYPHPSILMLGIFIGLKNRIKKK